MEKGLIVPLDDVYRLVGVLTTIEFEPIDPDAEEGEDDEDDEELNPAYRFLHDRVQQAAYSLIPEAEREGTHLAIARALDRADAEDRDLFGVANQYARSYQLIRDPGEREAVARLFHAAGERARLATAHEPAIRFFESAAKLLDDPWGAQYELGWSTSFQRAASEYLGGDTDLAERMTDELLGRSREKLEKLQIYNLKVEIRAARSDFKDAVDVCREAVALTGVSIPQDPGVPAMLYEVFKTQFIIRKTPPLEIADLPAATDPEMILTLKLLNTIAAAAFFVNANLGSIVLMKMTQTSYLHGNAPDSAFAWGCYCMVVGPILGNFEKALLYNESAKRIAAEYPDPGQMAKWPSSIAGLVQHWSHDPRSAIPMLLDAFAAGLEAGDPLHAHYCAVQLMNLRIMLGDNLDEVGAWARTYIDHAVRYQIGESMQSLEADLMLVRVLRGDTGDVLFGESEAEEAAWRARLEGFQMKLPAHAWLTYKGLALLFMGQAKEARPFLVDAFGYDSAVSANPQYSQHHWLLCQADLAAWDALDAAERKEARKRIRKAKKRIDTWAKTSPLGFTHKKLYVEAELARIDGDMGTATRLIDQAIDDAAENRYPHNEGWFNERAAAFHTAAGRRKVARVYLRAARSAYEEWGASAVVRRLDAQHPGLALELLGGTRGETATVTTGTRAGPAPSLDLQTVLRASEVVAREIVIDRLLDRLLHLAVENAGARRALLILDDGGELVVRAERLPETEEATLFDDRKVAGDESLSQAVVNLVARTRKASLVEDTAQPGQFTSCPYVRARRTRAILCVPLVHGDQLTGVLYLENDLTIGAFTPERLELLRLLSSQIAISIENAALYADSERMAGAFARFVPQQFLTFLDKESILEIGLGDAVQRSMTLLFSDIRHFTSLSERMTPEENFAFLNEYLSRVGPVIRKHDGFIDKYIGDAVMALFPNSPDDAVRAALEMQSTVEELNVERAARGLDAIEIGVGLHHGSLMLGTIGEKERIDSTVISDAVNIASRLEGLTKTYGSSILISGSTVELLSDHDGYSVRSLGEVELRGREQAIQLFEVTARDEAVARDDQPAASIG